MARVEFGACRQLDNRISCSTIAMKKCGDFCGYTRSKWWQIVGSPHISVEARRFCKWLAISKIKQ
jgi:hypothetical protein